MNPDEPACWSWPIPPTCTREEAVDRDLARLIVHDSGSTWTREDVDFLMDGDDSLGRWNEFHADRCALCGAKGVYLVDDHCHATGQIRGRLCRGCNTREGKSHALVVVRYRRGHPAAILDTHEMYSGRDWRDGYWIGDKGFDSGEMRPPTPWPAWER